MDNILNPLSDFIQSNSREDIYIRFTLGKYSNSFGFDKQLFNRENFDKIKDMLESNKGWKDKIEEVYEFTDEYPIKVLDTMIIMYVNGPYDILVTAETRETEDVPDSDNSEVNVYTYSRKHHNFVLKNYTFIVGDNIQKFELFVIDTNVSSNYLAHSSMLKIKDITGICDKPENDIFEILQKNN
jgi:hypothetical protein|tara:strand:- start:740 stop:1291 length:552 start_codon:yes stop_codon:yes gene_type:complete